MPTRKFFKPLLIQLSSILIPLFLIPSGSEAKLGTLENLCAELADIENNSVTVDVHSIRVETKLEERRENDLRIDPE